MADDLELPDDVIYGPAEIAERHRYAGRRVLDDYATEVARFLRLVPVPTAEMEESITRAILDGNAYAASLYAQATAIDGLTPEPPTLSRNQIGHNP